MTVEGAAATDEAQLGAFVASIEASDLDAKVGGLTAGANDFASHLGGRMPLLIGVAHGVIVAIFQWGWAGDLVGVDKPGPIDAWIPIFLFAIVFGLSMDYEVFLLSRIKEEYERTKDNSTAVADGLTATSNCSPSAWQSPC